MPGVGLGTTPAVAQDNGAAKTPQLGWSSWSFIRQNPTESNIEAQAKAMHDTGLVGHGFDYVNIDDYYYLSPKTTVDGYGRWVTDPARFPDGMAAVANYVHGLGEKFGMYLTPGIPVAAYNQNTPIEGTTFHAQDIVSDTKNFEVNYNNGGNSMYYVDYAKNPVAAQAFLNSWANELASWGVDYVKIDGVGDWDIPDVEHWSQALNQTGRVIHLELSNSLDVNNGATWRQYANGWRVSGDIECYCSTSSYPLANWNNVSSRFGILPKWTRFAGTGGWNDPDSVELGNGANDGLTADERQTQLTLWAIAAAPMVLGSDLTAMDPTDLALLSNDEVLGVDRLGHPGHPVDQLSQQQVWFAPNGDGSYSVALFNLGSAAAQVTANFADLGFSGSAAVRDLWRHTDLGSVTGSYRATLNPHAATLLTVRPAAGFHYTGISYHVVNAASGQYLDVSSPSTVDGGGLVQAPANGQPDQLWQLVPVGDGSYKLVNRNSGDLVNIPGNSTAPGTQLIQYHDDGGSNSRWQLTDAGPNQLQLVSAYDGQLVDVSGGSTSDGGAAIQWPSNGGANQNWLLTPVG